MAWDESEHPRESDGKFTDGAGQSKQEKLDKAKRIYGSDDELLSLPLGFFSKKKSTQNVAIPNVEKAYEFNRLKTSHHERHAKEMGFSTQKEYEKAAVSFFNSNRGKLYFSSARKRFYRYDEKTGEFASSSNGVIHTYMFKSTKRFRVSFLQDELTEV